MFPILWNLDGLVVESFAPDFWLPDLELYIEMTTLKQSLVRKKNRKLRRLRELYPDIRIKLFYGRDFRALMLKYGQHGLIGAMSGTLGQSTPPRLAAVIGPDEELLIVPVDRASDPRAASPDAPSGARTRRRGRPDAAGEAAAARHGRGAGAGHTSPRTPPARRSRCRRPAAAAAAAPVKTDG